MNNNAQCTHIFTNKGGNTLIREFEGLLQYNPQIKNLDAVVGFLRASGYFSLRPFLDNINKVRVLIGIDVDKYIVQAIRQGKLFFGAEENVKEECLRKMRKDIETSNYKKEIEEGMFQMVQDLLDGKLELRAHPSKKIHAKIYILYPEEFNQYTQGVAITGSSNLSGSGLGITQECQYEFNVKMEDFSKPKIIWKRIGSILRFSYDNKGCLGLDSTCFAIGDHIEYLCCVLNSLMGHYLLKDSPKTGTGDLLVSVQAIEPIRIPFDKKYNKRLIDLLNMQIISPSTSIEKEMNDTIFTMYGLSPNEREYITLYIKQSQQSQ